MIMSGTVPNPWLQVSESHTILMGCVLCSRKLANYPVSCATDRVLVEPANHLENKVLQRFTCICPFQRLWLPKTVDLGYTCFHHGLKECSLRINIMLQCLGIKLRYFNVAFPALARCCQFIPEIARALCHTWRRLDMQGLTDKRSKGM